MPPIEILSLLISAILLAGLYSTMSYVLALIYGVMKIVNLSHAGFMMLGAYAAFVLISPVYGIQLNPFIPPLIVVPVFFLLAWAYNVCRAPRSRSANDHLALVALRAVAHHSKHRLHHLHRRHAHADHPLVVAAHSFR